MSVEAVQASQQCVLLADITRICRLVNGKTQICSVASECTARRLTDKNVAVFQRHPTISVVEKPDTEITSKGHELHPSRFQIHTVLLILFYCSFADSRADNVYRNVSMLGMEFDIALRHLSEKLGYMPN